MEIGKSVQSVPTEASDEAGLAGTADLRARRIAWVDYAKGWSIVLVVTMHSALGVGLAVGTSGWLHELVEFAKPFRMPDFFLVAGLFAGRAIAQPWAKFIDRKILHFAYFYALWLFIAYAVKSGELDLQSPGTFLGAYLFGFLQPFSSMWFIYLLPFLFLAVRLTRSWPVPVVLGVAVAMHVLAAQYPDGGVYAMSSVMTGWTAIDSFLLFFIYFLCGHVFRNRIFAFSNMVSSRPRLALAGLVAWAIVQEIAVKMDLPEIPGATLLFGLTGAFAVIVVSVLLAKTHLMRGLAYCGRNSLVIYLSFFLPMAATRILILQTGIITDVGSVSLIVALVSIASPLVLNRIVAGTVLGFLFKRPAWARLKGTESQKETPKPRAAELTQRFYA